MRALLKSAQNGAWILVVGLLLFPLSARSIDSTGRAALDSHGRLEQPQGRQTKTAFLVEGRVTDDQGRAVSGAVVRACCGIGTLRQTGEAKTDANGAYRLSFGPGVLLGSAFYPPGASNHLGVGCQFAIISATKSGYFMRDLGREGDLQMAEPGNSLINKHGGVVWAYKPYHLDFVLSPAARLEVRWQEGPLRAPSPPTLWLGGKELPPAQNVLAGVDRQADGRFHFDEVPIGRAWWFVDGAAPGVKSAPFRLTQPGNYLLELKRTYDGGLEYAVKRGQARRFVRLVVETHGISFQGESTTWKELPALLIGVLDSGHTVFEFAAGRHLASGEAARAQARAKLLAQQYGFESFSDVEPKPWKSKGSPTLILPPPRRGNR